MPRDRRGPVSRPRPYPTSLGPYADALRDSLGLAAALLSAIEASHAVLATADPAADPAAAVACGLLAEAIAAARPPAPVADL
jgi:hypothetical protein